MRIPILLMVRELGPGGTERQLTETAKSLDAERFAPHVGCFHQEGIRAEELRAAGVPIVRFPVRSFASLETLTCARQMGRYLRQHAIRLVHTFDVPMNLFGVPTARWFRTPVVLSSQRAHRQLVSPTFRCLLRATDRMVDGVVVNCEAIRGHLTADYGVPGDRLHLCYNGIDTTVFKPAPGGSHPDEVWIGGVYALRPEKDLETLLDAFAQVHARRPETRLRITGSGPSEQLLRARAASLGLQSVCRFEPATAEAASCFRSLDIFVLPSRSEALSNSLMEAMACGCASIASRVGGNPELITHERTGLLFKAGDAAALAAHLDLLTENVEFRHALGAAAAGHIRQNFSGQAAARRMGEIYTAALERARVSRELTMPAQGPRGAGPG